MHTIKIMSYNVCWEALTATRSRNLDMTFCKPNKENKCLKSIIMTIDNKLKQNYDFICLQEISSTLWHKISINMNLENYNIIHKDILPSGVLILYHT